MNGVTVIAERVVPDYVGWLVLAVLFGAVALLPLGVVIWWLKGCFDTLMWGGPWACYRSHDWPVVIFASLLVLICVGLCVISAKRYADRPTHTEYTVKLDESASYLEFTERYEVLSEEDGIYRVREKEAAK